MLITKNEQNYINRTVLLHIVFLVVFYAVVDVFIIDYGNDENAFSKGFYSKFVLSIFYLIGSKERSKTLENDKPLEAAFHFSALYLCLWMGISSLVMENVVISGFVGVFLIFGGLGGFNLVDELLKIVKFKTSENSITRLLIESLLKIFLFSIFVMALFFIFTGEWQWDIKPFYEW